MCFPSKPEFEKKWKSGLEGRGKLYFNDDQPKGKLGQHENMEHTYLSCISKSQLEFLKT